MSASFERAYRCTFDNIAYSIIQRADFKIVKDRLTGFEGILKTCTIVFFFFYKIKPENIVFFFPLEAFSSKMMPKDEAEKRFIQIHHSPITVKHKQ